MRQVHARGNVRRFVRANRYVLATACRRSHHASGTPVNGGDLSSVPLGLHEDKSCAHPYLIFAAKGVGLGSSLQLGVGRITAMGFTSVAEDVPADTRGGLRIRSRTACGRCAQRAGGRDGGGVAAGVAFGRWFRRDGRNPNSVCGSLLGQRTGTSVRVCSLDAPILMHPLLACLQPFRLSQARCFVSPLRGSGVLLYVDRIDVFVT